MGSGLLIGSKRKSPLSLTGSPRRSPSLANRRAVGKVFFVRKTKILFDSPQQIGSCGARLVPQFKSVEIAISQTQHAWLQTRQRPFRQCRFPCPIRSYAGSEQYMCSVLHQRHESHLRIGAFTPFRRRTSEDPIIILLIGNIHSAPVQAHQAPTPVPSPFRRFSGNGLHHFVVQSLHRLEAKPGAGLRNTPI
ncbi:MAG: hypothetical protein A4E57_03987 [Syntrophorhabdaceae bacterium PtaU1.Bin034]|nr:MAG: hypothetical protein A4E57_03987 [Syntrophorhabdaceae bacterium PtaU1.Bin034]